MSRDESGNKTRERIFSRNLREEQGRREEEKGD
jgi:hypothetical protein